MLDEIMLETTQSTSDSTTPPSESQELNITKLLYLKLRKNIVDNDTEKLYTELKNIILPSYGDITTAKSGQSKKALENIIEKIDEDRKVREGYGSSVANEEEREREKETQARIEKTLKLYAEYFKIKFEGIGPLDNDFKKYIQNLTFLDEEFNKNGFRVNGNGLLSSIINPDSLGQIDKFLELEQVLEKYLLGLTIKTELQINFSEKSGLGQEYNASEIKNILAVFPGGYEVDRNKVVTTDVDFACIAGTAERVKLGSIALNNESVEENAIATVLEREAIRFAKDTHEGLQIHLIPCIQLALATNRDDVSDSFAIDPQKYIPLREILDLSYNLNKMVEREINESKSLIIGKYEELRTSNPSVKDIKKFVESMYNFGFTEKSDLSYDFLLTGEYQEPLTPALFITPKDLEEKYLKSPTERFKDRITKAAKDLPKHDYLKHLLDPEKLFKEDNKDRLDVKKIKNLIALFPTKEANAEAGTLDEEAQNKMLAGLVTLRNILDPYKTNDNNYFYFLKFNKKFEEETGKSFEDFFYKNINAPLVNGSPEVKEEFNHAKPILDTIASRINAKRISFGREKEDVSLLIQSLVLAEEKEDKIKKLFTETRDILELKNSSGENIAKILYQFSEEVLLTALEAKPELLEKIIEKNNQPSPFPPISLLQIITHENDKELLLNILKKYQEAHQKEGDADGKKALGEMIFQQNLLLHIVGENKVDLLEAIIPMLNIDDLNKADKDEKTPLYFACFKGHTDIVEALIAERPDGKIVDLNKANNNGATPLLAACANGHTDVVKALIEKKEVNLNLVNKEGLTPLAVAYLYGRIDIVKYLIEKEGVELDCPNKDGVTPLLIACANGHTDVVEALIKKEGVNLNHADKYGLTPLALACKHGHIDIVKALIKKGGVDLNPGNSKEAKPLYFACRNGNIHIAKALFEAGANVDCLKKERRLYGYNDVIDKKLIYNKSEGIKKLIKTFIDPKEIEKRDERLKNINKPHSDATSPSGVVLERQAEVAGGRVPSGRAPS